MGQVCCTIQIVFQLMMTDQLLGQDRELVFFLGVFFYYSSILFYPSFQQRQRVVSFCFFNHWVEDSSFIDYVSSVWVCHEGVSLIVSFMRNLQNLKPALCRHFGWHIRRLSEEVRITKDSIYRPQRVVEHNPMSDALSVKQTLQLRLCGRLLDWRMPLFIKSPRFNGWSLGIRCEF